MKEVEYIITGGTIRKQSQILALAALHRGGMKSLY